MAIPARGEVLRGEAPRGDQLTLMRREPLPARHVPVTWIRHAVGGMKRGLGILAAALSIATASTAFARHSHPLFYDWCKSVTAEGRVESVEFKNPHSIIVVRQDDGTAYTVDWLAPDALTRDGILASARSALAFGARVSVMGAPIRTSAEIRGFFPDLKGEVNPRTIDPWLIRRVGDAFSWAVASPLPDPAKCSGIFRTPVR